MTRRTTRLIGACLLAICASVATGKTDERPCTPDERAQANERLEKIRDDKEWSERLVAQHLPFGRHLTRHDAEGGPRNEVLLVQAGYVTLHDGDLRTALWTAHELTGEDARAGGCAIRVECFREDIRLVPEGHSAAEKDYDEPKDYDGQRFAMGHMVSDRDLRDDVTEQVNSYVMSNMSPQYGGFNGGVWLRLEELGRAWAERFGTVYVTSGAVFDDDEDGARDNDEDVARVPKEKGAGRVGIPSDFYKVILRRNEDSDGWSSISFLLEHRPGGSGGKAKKRLKDAIKSLEEIGDAADIDLHPELNRELLDESTNWTGWGYAPRKPSDKSGCQKQPASASKTTSRRD